LGERFYVLAQHYRPLAILHKLGAQVALMSEEGLGYSAVSTEAVSLTGEGERLRRSPVSSVEINLGAKLAICQATLGSLVPVRAALLIPVVDAYRWDYLSTLDVTV
jgi:hypothetical protein